MTSTNTPAGPAATTPAPKPSRAARSAAQAAKPAPAGPAAAKPAPKPAAAAKSTAKPAPAPKPAPAAGSVKDLGRDDKRALGTALITAAAAALADLDFAQHDAIKHLNRKAALQQAANWLAYVPGDWDTRLPKPTVGSRAAK